MKQYRIYMNECRIKSTQRRNNATSYKNVETVSILRQRNAIHVDLALYNALRQRAMSYQRRCDIKCNFEQYRIHDDAVS